MDERRPITNEVMLIHYKNPEFIYCILHDKPEYEEVLKQALEDGLSFNAVLESGNTLLSIAIIRKAYNIVNILCKFGATVNFQSVEYAIKNKDIELVKFLFSKCHNIPINSNISTQNCKTLLHQAIEYEAESIVNYLLENGASVDCQDQVGETPLHYAVKKNNIKIIRMLINNNAKLDTKNNLGQLSFDTAKYYNHEETIDFLKNEMFIRTILGLGKRMPIELVRLISNNY